MFPTRLFTFYQNLLLVSMLLPATIFAASLFSKGTCPVSHSQCNCNFKGSFYSVRCKSLVVMDDFKAVVSNTTDKAVILELDAAHFEHVPLNDLANSSFHTFIVGNSTFERFQDPSGMLENLTNLHHLSLENVTFRQKLQWGEFEQLKDLQALFLYNTSVQSVTPTNFSQMASKHIKVLTITHSNVTEIEDKSLKDFNNLLSLRISYNKLKSFSRNVLPESSEIEQIKLDHNKISTLPSGTFANLSNLTFLSLSNNSISTLPQDVFGTLWRPNMHLDLRANPIKCDCRIQWTVMTDVKPAGIIGQCVHPKPLFGKSLELLTKEDFQC